MLGSAYYACYPPMTDSGGKYTGCAHSKFGMIQFDGFLRVSLWRARGRMFLCADQELLFLNRSSLRLVTQCI